jgi:hypothetical protein
MQTLNSKKYGLRDARPSKIFITDSENQALNRFFSKCRHEAIEYGDTIIRWKAGKIVHVFFEDSVPVVVRQSENGASNSTSTEVAPSQSNS